MTDLTEANGQVFFRGERGNGQSGVFTSDGTKTGTRLVRDLSNITAPNSVDSPREMIGAGDEIFFTELTPNGHLELHKSDGTKAGTGLVKNLPGGADAQVANLTSRGGDSLTTLDLLNTPRRIVIAVT